MTSPEAFEDELRACDLTPPDPELRDRVLRAAREEASHQRDLRQLRWLFASVLLLMAFGTVTQRVLDRSIEQTIGIAGDASARDGDSHYCSALSVMYARQAGVRDLPDDLLRLLEPSPGRHTRQRPRLRLKREQSRSEEGAPTYV